MAIRIGQTVIVVQAREGAATTESPAIVTRVNDDDSLNVMVFEDLHGTFPHASVKPAGRGDVKPGEVVWRKA